MISNTADAQQRALPEEETFISKFSTMSSLHSHCRNVTGEESFLLNLTGNLFFIDYRPVKPLKTTKNQQRPASSQLSTFGWSCRASLFPSSHLHLCRGLRPSAAPSLFTVTPQTLMRHRAPPCCTITRFTSPLNNRRGRTRAMHLSLGQLVCSLASVSWMICCVGV